VGSLDRPHHLELDLEPPARDDCRGSGPGSAAVHEQVHRRGAVEPVLGSPRGRETPDAGSQALGVTGLLERGCTEWVG
jgi:hypothetical protein